MVLKKFFISQILVLSAVCAVFAQKKVALVIGNAAYKGNPLANPVRDAEDVCQKLESINFDVILKTDADTKTMDSGLDEFYKKSSNADIALLYYSGHGVESNGENFLIPVTSEIKSEKDLDRYAVHLNDVIEKSSDSGCKQLVIILDACRNNPLRKSRGASKGLSVVNASDVAENIIVYACGPGETADDGEGNHSPFTASLLQHITEPKVSFTDMLMEVSKEVQTKTNRRQTPWKTDNLTSQIYLNGEGHNAPKRFNVEIPSSKNGLVTLVLVLFIILVILCTTGFLVFTANGNKALAVAKTKAGSGLKKGRAKFSQTAENIREKIHSIKKSKPKEAKSAGSENVEAAHKSIFDEVCVNNSFYIMKSPVTVKEYESFSKDGDDEKNLPATNVSWIEAAKFCNELSEKENLEKVYDFSDETQVKADLTKNGWRLPSEKEWKAAAGKANPPKTDAVSLSACKNSEPNKLGLFDMYGLVWEWSNDSLKGKKILKGASWDSPKRFFRKNSYIAAAQDYKNDSIGFRGVRNK